MSLITISRGTFSGGQILAQRLASKLNYAYLTQEELSEWASDMSVPVERLKDALIRPPVAFEGVTIERDQYLACLSKLFCEKVTDGDLLYFGHLGHMLLPGLPNILRVRVLADIEYRIQAYMGHANCTRKQAREHIRWVDTTRDKWIRFLYGVDWNDATHYDIIINMAQTSVDAAVAAIESMHKQESYRFGPHCRWAIKNLHLAASVHFALLNHPRARAPQIRVTANNGIVNIKYLPRFAAAAEHAEEAIREIDGIVGVNTFIAQNTVVMIQESFEHISEISPEISRIATRLDASVDIINMHTEETGDEVFIGDTRFHSALATLTASHRLGDISVLYGNEDTLVTTLQRRGRIKLIILGKLYHNQPEEIQGRLQDELKNRLSEHLKLPILGNDDLRRHLRLGLRQGLTMAGALLATVLMVVALFSYQGVIINFIEKEGGISYRLLVVLAVTIAIPTFAFTYSTLSRQVLKLLGLD